MAYEPKVTLGPKVPVEDLDLNPMGDNERWGKPVSYGPRYIDILRWLGTQCPKLPEDVYLIAQGREGDITSDGETATRPTIIQWGMGASEFRLDAAQVGYSPHVARIQLINHFGSGDPTTTVMYAPPAIPPAEGEDSPVGERWEAMDARVGGKAYRPAPDNPTAKPYKEGDVYKGFRLAFVWVTFARVAVWVKVV